MPAVPEDLGRALLDPRELLANGPARRSSVEMSASSAASRRRCSASAVRRRDRAASSLTTIAVPE